MRESEVASLPDATHPTPEIPELDPRPRTVELPPPRLRVLVLEDDELQLQILKLHLETLKLEVLPASTIAAATEILNEGPIHLAILDIHLPDGSGLELCEHIDSDPTLSGLPIIMLSSMTEVDLVRRSRAAGACYFIGKPYDPNVLLAIIERALGSELQ